MDSLASLSWVDIAIVAALLLSLLIGLGRGGVRTLTSIISWAAAFYCAHTFAPQLAEYFKPYITNAEMGLWVARILIFIGVVIVGAILGNILGNLTGKGIVKGIDRIFGMLLGLGLGVIIVASILLLTGLSNFPETDLFKESVMIPHFMDLAESMKSYLPTDLQKEINLTPEETGAAKTTKLMDS